MATGAIRHTVSIHWQCRGQAADKGGRRHELDVPPAGLGVVRASVVAFPVFAGLALARQAVGGAVRVGLGRLRSAAYKSLVDDVYLPHGEPVHEVAIPEGAQAGITDIDLSRGVGEAVRISPITAEGVEHSEVGMIKIERV